MAVAPVLETAVPFGFLHHVFGYPILNAGTATHVLSFEGDSHIEWFEGNFEDYEEDKKRRLGEDAVLPKRIKYKKFARA